VREWRELRDILLRARLWMHDVFTGGRYTRVTAGAFEKWGVDQCGYDQRLVRLTSAMEYPAHSTPLGCYVVNIGDMMEVWTNGLWESTKHRVVHTNSAYRVSVPFFYEPRWDAVVKPLDKCVQQTGGTPKFGAKVYGEHLIEKVSGNFYSAPGESAT
jgi:hypothetical protein